LHIKSIIPYVLLHGERGSEEEEVEGGRDGGKGSKEGEMRWGRGSEEGERGEGVRRGRWGEEGDGGGGVRRGRWGFWVCMTFNCRGEEMIAQIIMARGGDFVVPCTIGKSPVTVVLATNRPMQYCPLWAAFFWHATLALNSQSC
jgi:hypothetical protein